VEEKKKGISIFPNWKKKGISTFVFGKPSGTPTIRPDMSKTHVHMMFHDVSDQNEHNFFWGAPPGRFDEKLNFRSSDFQNRKKMCQNHSSTPTTRPLRYFFTKTPPVVPKSVFDILSIRFLYVFGRKREFLDFHIFLLIFDFFTSHYKSTSKYHRNIPRPPIFGW